MRLLGRAVDIMITEIDTPGALAAGADKFIDGMMATWASADHTIDLFKNDAL